MEKPYLKPYFLIKCLKWNYQNTHFFYVTFLAFLTQKKKVTGLLHSQLLLGLLLDFGHNLEYFYMGIMLVVQTIDVEQTTKQKTLLMLVFVYESLIDPSVQ